MHTAYIQHVCCMYTACIHRSRHELVKETTHEDGHIIDLVITRHDDILIKATTVPGLFSDHGAIHIDMNATKPCVPRKLYNNNNKLTFV